MNKIIVSSVIAFLLLGIMACKPNSPKKLPDFEKLLVEFNAQDSKWSAAIRNNDVSYIKNLLDENVIMGVPNKDYIRGKEKVGQQWQQVAEFLDDFHFIAQHIGGDDEILYETGLAFSTYTVDNKTRIDTTKYMTVWRYNEKGEFRVLADMFNEF